MDVLQPLFDMMALLPAWFAEHPAWAIVVIFLIAMGEALLIIGLFVPSTVVLVSAGALVGTGKLLFWPVMLSCILGCIIGDQLSYWAGRIYGDKLREMWPLKNYRVLLARGEDYVKRHGGKSIAIGRFIPGIKAVVPGIAGMFGMGQVYFTVVNLISGAAWGALHILPGVVLGQALALAGELSGKLAIVLALLLSGLALVGWFTRLFMASLSPYRLKLQNSMSRWALSKQNASLQRLGRILEPGNPNGVILLMLIGAGLAALIFVVAIITGLVRDHSVSYLDRAMFNFFSEMRSAPGDEIFVRVSMLGDEFVLYMAALVSIIWLALQRHYRAAWAVAGTIVLAKLVRVAFSFAVTSPGIGMQPGDFRFPSGHDLMAATVYFTLGLLIARGLNRWSRALVVAGFAMLVVTIGFARLYLGVSWLTDVAGGILIGGFLAASFSVTLAASGLHKFRPLLLLGAILVALVGATSLDSARTFDRRVVRFQPVNKITTYTMKEYLASGWSHVAGQRVNLVGRLSDVFVAQWVGPLPELEAALSRAQYKISNKWGLREVLPYLSAHTPFDDLPPNPVVHNGLRAKLTAVIPDTRHPEYRLILRAFKSNSMIDDKVVYLISISHETVRRDLGLFSVPSDSQPEMEESLALVKDLARDPSLETLGQPAQGGRQVIILRAKS